MIFEQRIVIRGVLIAIGFCLVVLIVGYRWYPWSLSTGASIAERLVFGLRWDVWILLPLIGGIIIVGSRRFIEGESYGSSAPKRNLIRIDRAYLSNTVEQVLLAIPAHLAFAGTHVGVTLRVIPLLVIIFVVGRIAFWVGYRKSPPMRAFGFAATFYPTLGLIIYLLWVFIFGLSRLPVR